MVMMRPRHVRRGGEMVHARRLGQLHVAGVPWVGVGQRDVSDPVVTFGMRVNDQGIGRGSLPQPIHRHRERIRDGDEGERIVLGRPLVLFVLARVASYLREARILEEAAAAGVRMHGVE